MRTGPKHTITEEKEGWYRSIFAGIPDGLIITDLETGRVLAANPAACAMHGYSCAEFIGLLPGAFIHLDSQTVFKNYLLAVRSGAKADKRMRHVRRDGSAFSAEWRGEAFPYQDRPCLLGMVRDVSDRVRAEQQLRERVRIRTHEQSTLLEISHALTSTLELQAGVILEQLHTIINYTYAGLFGLDDSSLTALAMRGPQKLAQAAPYIIRLDGPATLATLFNGHQPIRIADMNSPSDPQAAFLRQLLNGNAAVLLEGVHAWMWVPVAVKGRLLGGLGIAHARRNYFTAHHAALAMAMADQVAIAMINAELYEHAQTLAALQERQRLAQNLHEAVNQSLFSAGLIAEVLPRLWERNPAEARQSLEDLRRLTRGALAEMRELLAELRPSVLTDSSLGDLLRQLTNAFTGRTNIPVSVNITGEHVLPAEIQVALYRVCQEALNNIAKHAKASRVEIEVHYPIGILKEAGAEQAPSALTQAGLPQEIAISSVEMHIRDDGQGFDSGRPAAPGHYGLGMMSERAEAVGANLTVVSQPGCGSEVTLRWLGNQKEQVL